MRFLDGILVDRSLQVLLASNTLTILAALVLNWSLQTVMVGYWVQSLIIGFFTIPKILWPGFQNAAKNPLNILASLFFALFFVIHFGMFHLGYGFFLGIFEDFGGPSDFFSGMTNTTPVPLDWTAIGLMGIIFFVNHAFSFWVNFVQKQSKSLKPISSAKAMFEPYERIIPMHLTILFGGFLAAFGFSRQIVLALFLVLKTLGDIQGHTALHQKKSGALGMYDSLG